MRLSAVTGGTVVVGGRLERTDLALRQGRITAIGEGDASWPALDAKGLTVLPGFIDIHCHGGGGHSFFTRDPGRIAAYAAWAPRNGVTAFLVSLAGNDPSDTNEMLRALTPVMTVAQPGSASPLGFHLEGPFINPVRRGAFPGAMLRAPSVAEFEAHQEAAGGHVRQVTIAPELPGALEVVRAAADAGAIAAMGHSDATVDEARAGFDAGISHVTHLFNAMRPIHQRDGGPAVAAFLSSVTCELIFDGAHVDRDVLRMAYRLLGPERTIVVTDNLYLAGTDEPAGPFAGGQVQQGGGVARRDDGTIVGSTLTMDAHFRNVVRFLDVDLPTAAELCSGNAARSPGLRDRGRIAAGNVADLVLVDEALEVAATVCWGVVAYLRDPWRVAVS